jgi:hypothetical protein
VGDRIANFRLSISDWRLAQKQLAIGNCKSAIVKTHPLPPGGTDLMSRRVILYRFVRSPEK